MWDFKEAILAINRLKKEGVIADYAVGGGISTIFYTEPLFTYDLDVFIVYEACQPGLVNLSGISQRLKKEGYDWKGEHIVIGNMPVQFFVADSLEAEAIKNARTVQYENVDVKIFSPEYLIAIMLRVGRDKDFMRIRMLLIQTKVDKKVLMDILKRYDLSEKYTQVC